MNEEVAKTKWCPMVRSAVYSPNGAAGVNRGHDMAAGAGLTRCIGSGCMMWREAINGAGSGQSSFYCGLAGKP